MGRGVGGGEEGVYGLSECGVGEEGVGCTMDGWMDGCILYFVESELQSEDCIRQLWRGGGLYADLNILILGKITL